MRRLLDVLLNIKFPLKNIHKQTTLEEMLSLFPDRKFILVGDNTQHDLSIYMAAAEKFPRSIKYIIIRKVVEQREDENLIKKYQEKLKRGGVMLYYADHFPNTFSV
jgi:phosphatidate phosphatase APP1